MKNLYSNRPPLTKEENYLLATKVKAGDPVARHKMIEGNAGFAYNRALKYSYLNKTWTRISDDDILQSAFLGLTEAVDRYDPSTGYAFTTYAHFWILKRITEEINATHWTVLRPPRTEMRAFFYGKMDSEEAGKYIEKYVRGGAETAGISNTTSDDKDWIHISIAVEKADLTEDEARVYHAMYGDNPYEDRLTDFTRGQLGDIEFSMLVKIKEHL